MTEASFPFEPAFLMNQLPDIIYCLDREGCFTYLSANISHFGYQVSNLLGKHFSQFVHPDDLDLVSRAKILSHLEGKTTGDLHSPGLFDERRTGMRSSNNFIVRILPVDAVFPIRDEQCFEVEINSSGLWSEGAVFQGTIGVIRDVSRKKNTDQSLQKIREDLLRAERVASLGTLAAGLAHDFNNILQVISLDSDMGLTMAEMQKPISSLIPILKRIQDCVLKAADLTHRLLRLGRSQTAKLQQCHFSELLDDCLKILKNQIRSHGIQVHLNLDSDLPSTFLDRGQFLDVLINLCTNSIHAIEECRERKPQFAPEITIGCSFDKSSARYQLSVSDNGMGIRKENFHKIFDPFFTTKTTGEIRGTGLGLPMVYRIVHDHGGTIQARSVHYEEDKKNHGTTFSIFLPCYQITEPKIEENEPVAVKIPSQTVVFVVDDQPEILYVIQTMLGEYCQIYLFTNGQQVLEEIRDKHKLPDVIISDLQMPVLTGSGLFQEIQSLEIPRKPKFLLISGILTDQKKEELRESGLSNFLEKPFTHDSLVRAVMDLI